MYTQEEVPSSEDTNESVLYRRLWLHVLLRAKQDADGIDLMFDNEGEEKKIRRDGKNYLTQDTEGLKEVCEYAGADVKKLLEVSRRRYGKSTNK